VRYFYAWTPLVILGAVVLLCVPYLGLLVLMLVALAAAAALVWAIVSVPYRLARAVGRRWQHAGASAQTAPFSSPAGQQNPEPVFGQGHVS
jgi:hypothetical protein